MRGLLLLPLLLPLGAALVVGLLNLSTPARLRLLLWTSPSLSLGELAHPWGGLWRFGGQCRQPAGGGGSWGRRPAPASGLGF